MLHIQLPDVDLAASLEKQATDTFYYNSDWLDLLHTVYGYSTTSLTTQNDKGQITGFLPLCSIATPFMGKHLVALPFSDHCPLLATNDADAHALLDQAIELAQQQKARYLELRTGYNEVLARRSDLVAVEELYVQWLLSLTTDTSAVWSGLRKPIQRQIKKSTKLGVQVHVAQRREEMEHFYRLHLQTRSKKHGMPAQPRQFFYGLWDRFAAQQAMQLLLATYEHQVIAAMIILASGTTVKYAYGASDANYLHLAPNDLLLWTVITWGCEHGYKTLDLGRTACDNEGLMEFKRRWGATQNPLPYYYYPQQAGLATTSEKSWKYQMLTGTWKKLPLQLTGSLGGYLYRYLG
jgi:FemAB-related protein (PEP-CTERM system-associated)